MPLDRLNQALINEIKSIESSGRLKDPERVILERIPPGDGFGPRYRLRSYNRKYLKMNSNSYLGLSNNPKLIEAANKANAALGVGPGAVRFIDGTFRYHVDLESRIADFSKKPACKIFNSAYTANLGLAITLSDTDTFWIGDQLNHNNIIRAMRFAAVPRENRNIFKHNDVNDLKRVLDNVLNTIKRVLIIFDGVFSMRGDHAPLKEISELAKEYNDRFKDGVITIVDDSHGVGAYGETGRGTVEYTGGDADIIVGTLGKAFGCNGGYIAASKEVAEAIYQKCDTYIYTNPLAVSDCAASLKALEIVDSEEGLELLSKLKKNTELFRKGIEDAGIETIPGSHLIVPILVRNTDKTHKIVNKLFETGILVVGLTYPIVPEGDETIRAQISASHTDKDIEFAHEAFMKAFKTAS